MGLIIKEQQCARTTTGATDHRPPGAVSETVFLAECVQCKDCVAVCPRGAIRQDSGGYPYLVHAAACSHCGLCADVCMHGAICLNDRTSAGLMALRALDRARLAVSA